MSIKIGNIDVSYFKVGGADCSIYIGNDLMYPTTPPAFEEKYKLTLNDGSTVSAACDGTSVITSDEISTYESTLVSAEIGDCVTSIDRGVFSDCRSITSVTIPDSVTSIGNGAFQNCTGLTNVTIGDGVTIISGYTFQNCSGLTSITVNATTPPRLGSNTFYNTNECPIYVPCESVEAYKAASGWSTYASRLQCIPTPHDYSQDYLTFRALEDGTFSFGGSGAISANTLEYSVDSGSTWSTLQNGGTTPTVTSGNTILWKASGLIIGTAGIGKFSSTSQFEAEGNIMSLLFGDNFSGQTSLSGYDNAFMSLFYGCNGLTSAENLALPATTLAEKCYQGMFRDCTSLTTAPVLPATTLASNCYYSMFQGCTSLNSITCLATDISATRCTYEWMTAVAASGTFTKAASMTNWTTGDDGIPSGWTVVDYSG